EDDEKADRDDRQSPRDRQSREQHDERDDEDQQPDLQLVHRGASSSGASVVPGRRISTTYCSAVSPSPSGSIANSGHFLGAQVLSVRSPLRNDSQASSAPS